LVVQVMIAEVVVIDVAVTDVIVGGAVPVVVNVKFGDVSVVLVEFVETAAKL
jgi:hypothetical protein